MLYLCPPALFPSGTVDWPFTRQLPIWDDSIGIRLTRSSQTGDSWSSSLKPILTKQDLSLNAPGLLGYCYPPLQANLSQVILKPWYIEDLVYLLSPTPWDSHPCPRPSYRLCTNLKSHIFIYVYLIQIFSLAHTLTRSTRASNRLSSCKINTGTLAYHFCQTWIPSIMTFKIWNLIQSFILFQNILIIFQVLTPGRSACSQSFATWYSG